MCFCLEKWGQVCVCHERMHDCKLTNPCVHLCVYAKYVQCMCVTASVWLVHRWMSVSVCVCCACVCAFVGSVRVGFGVGVLSSVHQKLKPVRLPYFLMEPPDVIAANPHHVIWLNSIVHNPFSHLTNQINQSLSTTTAFPCAILCCTPRQPHVMFSIDNILLSQSTVTCWQIWG